MRGAWMLLAVMGLGVGCYPTCDAPEPWTETEEFALTRDQLDRLQAEAIDEQGAFSCERGCEQLAEARDTYIYIDDVTACALVEEADGGTLSCEVEVVVYCE